MRSEIRYINSSDHTNTIFKLRHPLIISENVGNLLFFREKHFRPKSVCAVEMTMYVYWPCINRNRKKVHASMVSINGKDMY